MSPRGCDSTRKGSTKDSLCKISSDGRDLSENPETEKTLIALRKRLDRGVDLRTQKGREDILKLLEDLDQKVENDSMEIRQVVDFLLIDIRETWSPTLEKLEEEEDPSLDLMDKKVRALLKELP
jgi:hypothetical protein